MAGIVSDCDGRSPIAWQDLREISGWPLVVQVDNVSNVHLDHVNMLLIAPACVPVLYFCARQSHLILVTATKLFLYDPHIKSLIDTVFGMDLFVVSKVRVSFLEKEGRGGGEGWIFATLFNAGNVLPRCALVCPWAKLIEALADSGNAYWPRRNWSGIKIHQWP